MRYVRHIELEAFVEQMHRNFTAFFFWAKTDTEFYSCVSIEKIVIGNSADLSW